MSVAGFFGGCIELSALCARRCHGASCWALGNLAFRRIGSQLRTPRAFGIMFFMASLTVNLTSLKPQELRMLRGGGKQNVTITVRIGGKRIDLPVAGTSLTSDESGLFTFVSIPEVHAIFGATSTGSEPIRLEEKESALKALKGTISRAKRGAVAKKARRSTAEIDPAALAVLEQVAAWNKANGVRVIPDADSGYKVRTVRGKRSARVSS
jgi:hypothetical protein